MSRRREREGPRDIGAAVRLTNVSKAFQIAGSEPLTAVDNVSIVVQPGTTVALTGPSGSGKSTLLHLIGAIERADHGDIHVDDHNLAALSRQALADYRRHIGFVFQRYNLLPALTALDNVLAPVLPYSTSYNKVERAKQLLSDVGLAGRENSSPSRLSGGQQQRIGIARALIGEPRLLLADEPTGNLDSATGSAVIELLLRLRDQRGMTIIMATHDPQIAARADRIMTLHDGRLADDTDGVMPPSGDIVEHAAGLE